MVNCNENQRIVINRQPTFGEPTKFTLVIGDLHLTRNKL